MSLPAVSTALALVVANCCTPGHPGAVEAADTVSAQRPLRGNDTVVSTQGKFELGLLSPGSSGRYYIGIWYKNVPVQTVIWVGNRGNPLFGVASAELRVSSGSGNLELVGLNKSSSSPGVVWSSNLSPSSASPSPGSNVVVMRDNGNLVLLDGATPSTCCGREGWLGVNKLIGEYQALTSWRNGEDPAPGMFTDTMDRNGSSDGVWTGRVFANLPKAVNNVLFDQTYVEMPAYRHVTSMLYNNSTITRMVLDLTGQTKQYIRVAESQSWQFFRAAPTVQCDEPAAVSVPGRVRAAAERDWGLSDWSGGCHRTAPLGCGGNGSADGFLELPNMKLPDDSVTVSAQSRADFHNLEQLYADAGGLSSSLYLRLSESKLQHLRGAKGKNRRLLRLVLGIVSACLAALGASALVAWMLLSRRKRLEKVAIQNGSSLQVYSYSELCTATKNFSERLGGGGFGTVYRRVVNGHTQVAVKKLSTSNLSILRGLIARISNIANLVKENLIITNSDITAAKKIR
ncbi:G-type lectin S-receptor-like serine/threonine-protein kinase [Panicum miliaceum]|uniref:non-specific serine/threonine protein kinase n=1 Tax=Panicum miliaceum TaxID=4540 RepID=A0A3L6QZ32_PANMI|nr:G-type lectin S-receptor-like serine/threonine-protein kinase [Panicum miliaceum]